MQEPIKINRKNRKIATSPELADVCFTCGTCSSGSPESDTGHCAGFGTGGYRFQMALGLHALRQVPVCLSHGGTADQNLPCLPDSA